MAALVVGGSIPPAAGAAGGREVIALLNVQRAANGLPAVRHDSRRTRGCRAHDLYMRLNGFGHGEVPGRPGYSLLGAALGGTFEVLSFPFHPWTAASTPWDAAPIHRFELFDPARTVAGAEDAAGFNCLRLGGYRRTRRIQTFAFPGSDPGAVPTSERPVEYPYTPPQLVGLRARAVTGPNIPLWVRGLGPRPRVTSVRLVGPRGPEPVRVATTALRGGWPWLRGGGIMVPLRRLASGSPYAATVRWRGLRGRRAAQRFGFTTR